MAYSTEDKINFIDYSWSNPLLISPPTCHCIYGMHVQGEYTRHKNIIGEPKKRNKYGAIEFIKFPILR